MGNSPLQSTSCTNFSNSSFNSSAPHDADHGEAHDDNQETKKNSYLSIESNTDYYSNNPPSTSSSSSRKANKYQKSTTSDLADLIRHGDSINAKSKAKNTDDFIDIGMDKRYHPENAIILAAAEQAKNNKHVHYMDKLSAETPKRQRAREKEKIETSCTW